MSEIDQGIIDSGTRQRLLGGRAALRKALSLAVLACGSLATSGCMTWTPGWEARVLPVGVPSGASARKGTEELSEVLKRARETAARADSEPEVEAAIALYEQAAAQDPGSLEALTAVAELTTLLGAAYRNDRHDKARAYRTAIQHAERAMALNEQFLRLVENGASVAEACPWLQDRELQALHAWTVAISYYFKECTSGLGHLVNLRWMARHTAVVEHMERLDPEWGDGAVLFARGVYFLALPRIGGRDLERSAEYMRRAIKAGPRSLLPRWGRAKYLHVLTGDRDAFVEDLQWVLAQDPRLATSPFAWNAYFQRDARQMLDQIDEHFR